MIKFDKRYFKYFSLLGTLGFIMISNIFIMIFIYKLIEKFIIKSDLLFIICILFGVCGGFYNIYKEIKK